jgi:hypothetical protein
MWVLPQLSMAQQGWFQSENKKGQLSIYWGYNRSHYTPSDIRFTGSEYDFTLSDVKAKDRPSDFGIEPYFKANTFTIPQYNFRLGYFIGPKWSLNFGIDHMKYVMVQNQTVKIDGYIDDDNSVYQGQFNGEEVLLTSDFLQFEHTDGLNYVNIEAQYFDNLYRFTEKHSVNFYAGGGLGIVYPKSNVQVFNVERSDVFHLAGYGISTKAGINITLWKYFFIQTDYNFGFLHMPDVLTRPSGAADRASHHFFYGQWTFGVGGFIPLSSK